MWSFTRTKLFSRFYPRCSVAVALVCLLGSIEATATTAIRLSDKELADESDLVVLVEVVDQKVFLAEDGHVYTDTFLFVDDVLKGGAKIGTIVVVRQWGGTLDGVTYVLTGDARLSVGEVSVLFLADREPGSGVVFLTALSQSKFDVVESRDGTLVLSRDFNGLNFYDPWAEQPLTVVEKQEQTTLETLRHEIGEVQR